MIYVYLKSSPEKWHTDFWTHLRSESLTITNQTNRSGLTSSDIR